jgi:hypothetical protein
MSTKIVPKSTTTKQPSEGETKANDEVYQVPSKRISSLTSSEDTSFISNSITTTVNATAAYVKDLNHLEATGAFEEARTQVKAISAIMEKLKQASSDEAARAEEIKRVYSNKKGKNKNDGKQQLRITVQDYRTMYTALRDYEKIKVEHEQMLVQKMDVNDVEMVLWERMRKVLLNTMDKQAVASMFLAFGANPTKRRRSGKHKSMLKMGRTASALAIAARDDTAFKEVLKLFPADPEKTKVIKQLLNDANEWSAFQIWKLRSMFDDNNVLTTKTLVTYIFEDSLDLLSLMKVDHAVFDQWVASVCDTYNAVPYHK